MQPADQLTEKFCAPPQKRTPGVCLVVDEMHRSLRQMFKSIGVSINYCPDLLAAEIPAALAAFPYDGLVVRSKVRVTASLLRHAPQLRYVARAGAGTDNIDEEALKAAGITLLNAPEGNRDAVGEHTLGLLLALFRHIVRADNEVRVGRWRREENRGEEIGGKTIGLLGYGNMGRAFAKRLRGFDCEVIAHDSDPRCKTDGNATLVSLPELQGRSDVISLHIPYSVANHHFVNDAFLTASERNFWLLNTARGEVLDHAALVRGLRGGYIRGAALDVLENERLHTMTAEQGATFEFLKNSPNVVLSPHIGGWTVQSYARINEVLTSKLAEFLQQQ
ncbi:2-hydroxyacid dehydrogenase [Hymenobacter saemangeumensis]|uniref:2-hydroxyacid dehydrogenase n=1 Tax=Hymenobacter saemangeumensis TaxID=1084522 RepID=A0ABP8IN40_9BACT